MSYRAYIASGRFPLRHVTLIVLWLALTLLNLNKAFHIDDTFHLQAARWIGSHPFSPMSGFVNWDNLPEPLYHFNQPPLFFYLIAGFTKFFGTGEIPLHLFLSIFTFAALLMFQKTGERLQLRNTNALLVLFALHPAFLVNQNLMTDVPILSIALAFTYFILKAKTSNPWGNYAVAALLLGFGLLIKYSLLPLIIAFLLITWVRRHYKYALVILIPGTMLLLWSAWNYKEYGAVHLLGRPREPFQTKHLWDFLNCLGAVSVFSIPLIYGLYPTKFLRVLLLSMVLAGAVTTTYALLHSDVQELYSGYLVLAFTINGCLIVVSLFLLFVRSLNKLNLRQIISSDYLVIFLIVTALSTFLVMLAPFMATRHILLVVPFLLLLGNELMRDTKSVVFRLTLALTALFGWLLGMSDWYYADYYRAMAAKLSLPPNGTIWYAGHWGWQWYAGKNGMTPYSEEEKNLKNGDYLVYPGDVSIQHIDKTGMRLVEKKWEKSSPFSWFSVSFASLYSSGMDKGVWKLSSKPIDTVYVYQIVKPAP